MKNSFALLAAAASVSQVTATFGFGGFHNAAPYTCPGNAPNKCDDDQQGGWSWDGVKTGEVTDYNNWNFKGWTCENDFSKRDALAKRTFGGKVISGSCGSDKSSAPSFGCDSGACGSGADVDKFSLSQFDITVEFDCRMEFHYDMPDGSTCKHSADCSKDGTTVKNTQCGGAKKVHFVYPKQPNKPKETCNVGVHKFHFDCEDHPPVSTGYSSVPAISTTVPGFSSTVPAVETTSEAQGVTTSFPAGEETTSFPGAEETTSFPAGEETTSFPAGETTPGFPGEETTPVTVPGAETTAPVEETTPGFPGEQTTSVPAGAETTSVPAGEETTSFPSGEETTPVTVPGAETTAPVEETTPGFPGEQTTSVPAGETTPGFPGEETETVPAQTTSGALPVTTSPAEGETTSVPAGEQTTSAPVGEETTAFETTYLTTFDSTSTVYTTSVHTITSCAPEVTNCPARSGTPAVETVTVAISTTICPVTEVVTKQTTGPAGPASSAPAESAEKPSGTAPVAVSSEKPVGTVPAGGEETTVYSTYDSTSTIYTTKVQTITSCAPEVTNCPARSEIVTVPVGTTVKPVTETVVHKPSSPAESEAKPVESVPATGTQPAGSEETGSVPGVVPSCLNTFKYLVADCKDNTDVACYCPKQEFVDEIFNCLYAHAESDDIVAEAVSFFQGVCAPYISENPGIATGADYVTSIITVTGTPIVTSAVYTTIQVETTITEPCVTEGTTIEGSSTVKVISTELTVPQVELPTAPAQATGSVAPSTQAPVATGSAGVPVNPSAPATLITNKPAVPVGTGGAIIPTETPGQVPVTAGAAKVGMGFAAIFVAALAL